MILSIRRLLSGKIKENREKTTFISKKVVFLHQKSIYTLIL